MNKAKKQLAIKAFEQYINKHFDNFETEKIFNKFLATKRQFRADYYIPSINCIIEINGGQWISGRHNRGGEGYERDLTKMNLAIIHGCYYLQYTYEMIARCEYINDLEELYKTKPAF